MRNETEVQHAHHALQFLLTREDPLGLSGHERGHVATAHDAIAWALNSGCGRTFAANLDLVLRQLSDRGIGFVDAGVVTATNPLERSAS